MNILSLRAKQLLSIFFKLISSFVIFAVFLLQIFSPAALADEPSTWTGSEQQTGLTGSGVIDGAPLIETPPEVTPMRSFRSLGPVAVNSFANTSSNVPRNGLVAEYLLDGNANDTSGNSNNGWVANASFTEWKMGQSALFWGYFNRGHIRVPNSTSLQFGTEASFSFWVKLTDNSGMDGWGQHSSQGVHTLIAKDHDRSGFVLMVLGNMNMDRVACNWISNNAYSWPSFSASVCSSMDSHSWHHVTYSIGGNSTSIYVDGEKIATMNTVTDFSQANGRDLYLGKFSDQWYPLNGQMDNVRIYNRAVSGEEVRLLYNEWSATPNTPQPSTPTSPNACPAGYICHSETAEYSSQIAGSNSSVNTANLGDPIRLSSGESVYGNTLMNIPGNGLPYEFSITNRSQTTYNGPIGNSWDHNHNIFLREQEDGSVNFYDGKLGIYAFARNADASYGYNLSLKASMEKKNGQYSMVFSDKTTYIFSATHRIATIQDKNANAIHFVYNPEDQLSMVTDTLGNNINYSYDDTNHLVKVEAPNSRSVSFVYYGADEENGSVHDLKSATIENSWESKTITFTYSKTEGNEILSHNLQSFTDASGKVYVQNTYDSNDRVVSQTYGDGTLTYEYSLDTENKVTRNTVTNKRGTMSEYMYDNRGNMLSMTVKADGVTYMDDVSYSYTYDSKGQLTGKTEPKGNGTAYKYDLGGNITEVRKKADMSQADSDSDIVSKLAYDEKNNIVSRTNPNGAKTNFAYDGNNNLIKISTIVSSKNIVASFEYDSNGRIIKATDPEGLSTTYEYSAQGLPTKITQGEGSEASSTTINYDIYGNPLTITDGEGNMKTLGYDAFNNLVSSITPEGRERNFLFNANNALEKTETILENTQKLTQLNSYDILDGLVGTTVGSTSEDEKTLSMVRDPNGNITETTDARGTRTQYAYDAFERIIEKRILDNTKDRSKDLVTKYSYDQNGNIVSMTDARNNVTTYEYDRFDRMVMSIDALGTRTVLSYDKSGNIKVAEAKDATGKTLSKSERAFDELGQVIRETQGAIDGNTGITTTVDYDSNGKPVKVSDAKANSTTITYDSLGRKKTVTDALGNKTILTYDKRGLVVKQELKGSDGKSIVTVLGYDKDGRLTSKTDGLGNKISSVYNKLGQVIQSIDAKGNKTDYSYDVFGNILSETKSSPLVKGAGGISSSDSPVVTSYEYDKSNNRTKLTDANGNITVYMYDSINRLTKEMLADGSFVEYEYDANGNILKKTDANGTIVSNTYDILNRLTKRTIQRGANILGVTEESFVYDSLGRLTGSTDSEGNTLAFTYDTLGRLVSETQNGKVVQTGYDTNSNITSLTYPSGKKVVRDYDVLNRLTGIALDAKNMASYHYSSITLDSLALANGTKTTYGYDAILRLKELTNTSSPDKKNTNGEAINKLSFSYDQNSNILSNGHDSYSYDSLSRLTSAGYEPSQDKKSITESFAYNPMGSRLSALVTETKTVGKDKPKVSSTTYDINNLNQYEGVKSEKNKAESYSYDKNGNLIQDDSQKYSYDYRNRLIEVKKIKENELVAKYSYDVLGRRLTKDTKETLTKFTYSNNDAIEESIYAKKDGRSELTETKEHIYGSSIDDIIATVSKKYEDGKIKETKTYYYHKNQLGSIIALTDESGKTIEEYRYDVFGKTYLRNGKSDNYREFTESKTGNTRLFTGREYDREIGLYYYRARFYSAELGRFISRDPIGVRDDVNLYGYVGNRVVGFVDPMGLEKAIIGKIRIYSNYGSAIDPIDGHSWIEMEINGILSSYWIGRNFHEIDAAESYLINTDSDITKNFEIETKDSARSNTNSIAMLLRKGEYENIVNYITTQAINWYKWKYTSPCSDFASDIWNMVSPITLDDRSVFGVSNPDILASSIEALRNSKAAFENQLNSQINILEQSAAWSTAISTYNPYSRIIY